MDLWFECSFESFEDRRGERLTSGRAPVESVDCDYVVLGQFGLVERIGELHAFHFGRHGRFLVFAGERNG